MWVVHIQLNGSEKIRNPIGLNIGSVYHVFVFATNDNLSGYHNFIVLIITQRALFFVSVVKCDRYRGFGNSSLTIFVHKFLEICSSHLKTIVKDENSTLIAKIFEHNLVFQNINCLTFIRYLIEKDIHLIFSVLT